MTWQGLLFNPVWRDRKIGKHDLVVMCDVSRSMVRTVRFLLMILHGLNSTMVSIRSYIFCSGLMEVTDVFRAAWGTGDSEMKRYMPYCHTVRECNTLAHLGKVVSDVILSH